MIDIQHVDRIKTFGHSMLPILKNGDIVYIRHVPFTNIKVNDIIIFKLDDHYVTHRVIYKKKYSLIAKGDNNLKADQEIKKDKIVGIVSKVKRNNQILNPENIYLVQSSYYFKEITAIAKALKKNKIDFVILKGLPLHLHYEGNHPRRIYTDCDILINSKDMDVVENVFSKNNYRKNTKTLTGEKVSGKMPEVSFHSTNSLFRVVFDIHIEPVFLMTQFDTGDIYYPEPLLQRMTEDFITRKRHIIIQGYSLPILSPQHLIPYLSLHFFHHNYRGIFRLELIHKVIMREKSAKIWKDIRLFINAYKLHNFVIPVFYLLRNYFNTNIPKGFESSFIPNNAFIKYIFSKMKKVSIYDSESRITAGINRFLLIFILSPESWIKKSQIFFNFRILKTIQWSIWKKIGKQ